MDRLDSSSANAPIDSEAGSLYGRLFPERLALAAGVGLDTLPAGGAVYALTAPDGTLLQLLETQSLRRAVALRLAAPASDEPMRKRADLRGVAAMVWWRGAHSVFESAYAYLQIARQLWGAGYRKQLAMAAAWYARLDWNAKPRRWSVSEQPFGERVDSAGPFVTRQRAAAFVESLEELFDLCRYPQEIARAPQGVRCAYFDMGKCPAPCDGTVGMDVYDAALESAVAFARGGHAEHLAGWHRQMSDAAARLDFESAQRCKERLNLAEKALAAEGRVSPAPDAMRYLIVQRGRTAARLKPFFFAGGAMAEGAEIPLRELDRGAAEWSEHAWPSDNAAQVAAEYRTDLLTLITHFLARGANAPGVYLGAPALHDARVIAASVREYMAQRTRRRAERSTPHADR